MPLTRNVAQAQELIDLAKKNGCILSMACKTAYATAYNRMLLLAKGGIIGNIISVDSVCTSIRPIDFTDKDQDFQYLSSLNDWGPTALLPIFQLLGTDYLKKILFH